MTPLHAEGPRPVDAARSAPLRRVGLAALRGFVALAGATAASASWLTFIDRVGVALVGGHALCGVHELWLIASCHAATALPLAATFLAFSAVPETFTRGRARYLVRFAGAVAGMLVGWVLFIDLPLDNVIPPQVALLMPLVAAITGGFATTLRTSGKQRYWLIGLATFVSFFAGMVDATVFPTLVAATHLRVHMVTVAAGVLGLGVPAGLHLMARRGRWIPATALVASVFLGSGVWVSLARQRGFVGAASPLVARLIPLLSPRAPGNVMRRTLSRPSSVPPSAPPVIASRSKTPRPRSVVLITVDALRADALRTGPGRGVYMRPGDTPFVDRWLERSTWFDTAYSQGTSTVDAMRSIMRGINADDAHPGANVPAIARHLGMKSLAVIPPILREDALFQTGLEQFERMDVYDVRKQEQLADHVTALLSELDGEPFFLWTHFFATHLPYYSLHGPREQEFFTPPTAMGRLAEEYREAVRWLDSQLARIARALEDRGLRESTIVVLTADHGEHIANGLILGHGDGFHESDIRIPLLFDVPGWPRATIPTLVSSRDILPTLVELLGGAPEPAHRGASLVPLMLGQAPRGPRVYPVRGFLRGAYGLIADDDLLVYSTGLAAFQRFPRIPGAESGRGDLFGRDRASDQRLVSLLAEYEPHPFLSELANPAIANLYAARIAGLDGNDPAWVDVLLRIAQHTRTPEVNHALEIAYVRATTNAARLRIATGAFGLDPMRWVRHLDALLRTPRPLAEETALLDEVERSGLARGVTVELGAERLRSLHGQREPALVRAWLSVLGGAPRGAVLLPELTALASATRFDTAPQEDVLLLLRAVEALSLPAPRPDAAPLVEWLRPLLATPNERLARAVCLALGAIGDLEDADRLSRLVVESPRTLVRRAAVQATARLIGPMALPVLRDWSMRPDVASVALTELGKIGGKAEVEWLRAETQRDSESIRTTMLLQTLADMRRRGVQGV